jgi:hypothetical protein
MVVYIPDELEIREAFEVEVGREGYDNLVAFTCDYLNVRHGGQIEYSSFRWWGRVLRIAMLIPVADQVGLDALRLDHNCCAMRSWMVIGVMSSAG